MRKVLQHPVVHSWLCSTNCFLYDLFFARSLMYASKFRGLLLFTFHVSLYLLFQMTSLRITVENLNNENKVFNLLCNWRSWHSLIFNVHTLFLGASLLLSCLVYYLVLLPPLLQSFHGGFCLSLLKTSAAYRRTSSSLWVPATRAFSISSLSFFRVWLWLSDICDDADLVTNQN